MVSKFLKILSLFSPVQNFSYGISYFSIAQVFIDFDKLIVWCCIRRFFRDQNQNQNQNSTKFFTNSFPIWLNHSMYFDAVF